MTCPFSESAYSSWCTQPLSIKHTYVCSQQYYLKSKTVTYVWSSSSRHEKNRSPDHASWLITRGRHTPLGAHGITDEESVDHGIERAGSVPTPVLIRESILCPSPSPSPSPNRSSAMERTESRSGRGVRSNWMLSRILGRASEVSLRRKGSRRRIRLGGR
jgi:hypothetical protein